MSISIETNGVSALTAECKKWEAQCAELIDEREQLRAELSKVQSERDAYLKSLYFLLRKDYAPPDFTREEVFAAVESEQSFGDLVAELERSLENPA